MGARRLRDWRPVLKAGRSPAWERQPPTWREARPALIADALKRAADRPSGNWYVLGASRQVRPGPRPFGRTVGGVEVVAWRDAAGTLRAGPGDCPHLGAPLADSRVVCGTLVCHWHGLALDGAPFAGWRPFPAYDDGVLAWVRLDALGGEAPTDRPVLPRRPAGRVLDAVFATVGRCDPEDVLANRLDPWHGSWFHPHSFTGLTVREVPQGGGGAEEDALVVDVSFRVAPRLVVPVRAAFTVPEPRTVVMHVTGGEGVGSVVETHATPLGPDASGAPATAVTEAVLATSGRFGFTLARAAAPATRALVRWAAGRLWREDLAYAERRHTLRTTGRLPG